MPPEPMRWRGEERDRLSEEDLPDFASSRDTVGLVIDHLARTTGALIQLGTRADVAGRHRYAALVDPTGEALREHLHLELVGSIPLAACGLRPHLAEADALADGATGAACRVNRMYTSHCPGD